MLRPLLAAALMLTTAACGDGPVEPLADAPADQAPLSVADIVEDEFLHEAIRGVEDPTLQRSLTQALSELTAADEAGGYTAVLNAVRAQRARLFGSETRMGSDEDAAALGVLEVTLGYVEWRITNE